MYPAFVLQIQNQNKHKTDHHMYMQWIHPNQTKCPNIQISNQTRDFKDPPKKKTWRHTWELDRVPCVSKLQIYESDSDPRRQHVTCFLPSKMPFRSPSPISFVGFCRYHTSACKHHSSPGDLLKCVWFFWGDPKKSCWFGMSSK